MATTLDPALVAAVKQSKSEVAKRESHKRQLARQNARKRAQKELIATRAAAKQQEIASRTSASIARQQAISQTRTQERLANLKARSEAKAAEREEREQASRPSREELIGRGTGTVIAGTGNFIGNHDLLSTTLWTMFGLIIVYLLVSNSAQFGGFTGSLSDLLHKATSTAPLFQVNDTKSS